MNKVIQLSKKVKVFLKYLDRRTKLDFIKAYLYAGFFRAFILFVPFDKLKKRMGKVKTESAKDVDESTYKEAYRIAWLVNKACSNTPWESKCLVRALTAQKLLKAKNISTTIYLGVRKDQNNKMIAHAWTRCGKAFITGGENKDGFAVVAKFAT